MLGLTALAAVRFWVLRSSYETDQVSRDTLTWAFSVAVWGLPLVALACLAVVAATTFFAPRVSAQAENRLFGLEVVAIAVATGALVRWAADAGLWQWANKFSYWALPVVVALMLVAVADALMPGRANREQATRQERRQLFAAQIVAASFSLVLAAQSVSWLGLTAALENAMLASPSGCVSLAPTGWLQNTALSQFATPFYSVLLQGQTPQKVVLTDDGCTATPLTNGVPLDGVNERPWNVSGWFNFQALGQRLAAEQTAPANCWFAVTTGWYGTETDGPFWWRWSDGRDAELHVVSAQDGTLTLKGGVQSATQPDAIDVTVNGQPLTTLNVTWTGLQDVGPLTLPVKRGDNVVRLVSHNAPQPIDGRLLGLGIANLALSNQSADACARRP